MSKTDKDEIRLTVTGADIPDTASLTAGGTETKDDTGGKAAKVTKDSKDSKAAKDDQAAGDPKNAKSPKKNIAATFFRLFRDDLDDDDDEPLKGDITLNKIFGGNILSTSFLQRQILVIIIIAAFTVVYISNRYSCQRSLGEISTLTRTLQEERYKALSINSQLTEMTRESHVLEYLHVSKDSTLHIATQPPYIINVPDKEDQPQ